MRGFDLCRNRRPGAEWRQAHLIVTDPPYGVDYDPDWRNRADRANGKPNGARAIGRVENDGRSDWSDAYALSPSDLAYVWVPAGPPQFEFWRTLSGSGFEIRMPIIWAKQHFSIGRGHYHVQHEGCLYAVRKGKTEHWNGDRTQTTLWEIDKPRKSETGHSTQKPVECMKRPIENNSQAGDAIYEPFSGSGTTIIAGEMTGRRVIAIELSPAYVDVAVERWQNFTGQKAINEATGQPFERAEIHRLRPPRLRSRTSRATLRIWRNCATSPSGPSRRTSKRGFSLGSGRTSSRSRPIIERISQSFARRRAAATA